MTLFYIANTRNGKGSFAKRNIKKDECILISSGKILRGKKYELDFPDKTRWWIQIGKSTWLDESSKNTRFVNHSCDPNATNIGKKLVALRDIKKDEEITYDYDTNDWDESSLPLKCKCGSRNCRKIIKGYRYLPNSLKNKYKRLAVIPNFLIQLENSKRL